MDLEKLIALGERMGLKDEDLRKFVFKKEEEEREERARERELERQRIEREERAILRAERAREMEEIEQKKESEKQYQSDVEVRILTKITKMLVKDRKKEKQNSKVSTRLPQLEMKKFDGDPLQFPEFWSHFEAVVHNNESLSRTEKFSYLRSFLVGAPLRAIEGLMANTENYIEALEILKERFGRKNLIISELYTRLEKIKPPNYKTSQMRRFVDEVESLIRSLKAHGKDVNNDQLAHTIQVKLPKEILLEISRELDDEWGMQEMWHIVKKHVNTLERVDRFLEVKQAPSGMQTQSTIMNPTSSVEALATQTRNIVQPSRPCIFCSAVHWSDKCDKFTTLEARKERVKGMCFKCFSSRHLAKACPRTVRCFHCKLNDSHHSSLCPTIFKSEENNKKIETRVNTLEVNQPTKTEEIATIASTGHFTMMQTATVTICNPQQPHLQTRVRILIDSGSSRTFISKLLAEKLQLQTVHTEHLNMTTFGTQQEMVTKCSNAEIAFKLRNGTYYRVQTVIWPHKHLTKSMRRYKLNDDIIQNIQQYDLADNIPDKDERGDVDIILGNDYATELILPRRIPVKHTDGLYLMDSMFGWVLSGRVADKKTDESEILSCFLSVNYGIGIDREPLVFSTPELEKHNEETTELAEKYTYRNSSMWERFVALETIGIKETMTGYNDDDENAMMQFNSSVNHKNGRYTVRFPWKPDRLPPENYDLAVGRLKSLARRIRLEKSIPLMENYNRILQEQEERGIIERVSLADESSKRHYLPHHPVITPTKSTTKVRLVYDASAKPKPDEKYQSLNECLYSGPIQRMLQDLTALLVSFRVFPIAVVADIEKAFLQIELQQPDRDMTRFLWFRDTTKPDINHLQVFRFCRVPFGVKSSPFLLAAVLNHHLKKYNDQHLQKLARSLYVDNVVTGMWNEAEVLEFYNVAKNNLQKEAQMNLREWRSNSLEFMQTIPRTDRMNSTNDKVLGIIWDSVSDKLAIASSITTFELRPTKRKVTHIIASLYDPMGLFSPVRLEGIRFMQLLWEKGIGWDDYIPTHLVQTWQNIQYLLSEIPKFSFPRFIGPDQPEGNQYSLFAFCDASKDAYATAVYIQCRSTSQCKAQLIFAKTRPSPKSISRKGESTIPRLELMAIVIGSKALRWLQTKLGEILGIEFTQIVLWSDSKVALHWVSSRKPLPVFVENRVREIWKTPNLRLHHVSSDENPADQATRPLCQSVKDFMHNTLWWFGPPWLSQFTDETQSIEISQLVAEGNSEITHSNDSLLTVEKYSTLSRLLRITAWIMRCARNWKRSTKIKSTQRKREMAHLEATELQQAKLYWEKHTQRYYFSNEIRAIQENKRNRMCQQLGLELDEMGVIRCLGRLRNTDMNEGSRKPKLLPSKSPFTDLVIKETHCDILHSGVSQTLAAIRQSYWITKGRMAVKRILRNCTICRRTSGGPYKAPMFPPFPKEIANLSPYSCTGLDYLGPVYVKIDTGRKKVWICIFTCRTVRAVHLEIVQDMSTQQFLLALRRFFARCGVPNKIISDNASHFKAANDVICKIYSDTAVHDFLSCKGVTWKYITPLAPWMGGFYERLVQSVKTPLKRTIGRKFMRLSELSTLLAEIEEILNDRPLTYIGDDINSSVALTPNRLLYAYQKVKLPAVEIQKLDDDDDSPDYTEKLTTVDHLTNMWKEQEQKLLKFWDLFNKEYLPSLRERYQCHLKQQRIKVQDEPKVGTIVLIQDNLPRALWKMGQIESLIKSGDGAIRSAQVQLPSGSRIIRSITNLFPLEVPVGIDNGMKQTDEVKIKNCPQVETHERTTRKSAIKARKNIQQWTKTITCLLSVN